jgi:hypothetical protein
MNEYNWKATSNRKFEAKLDGRAVDLSLFTYAKSSKSARSIRHHEYVFFKTGSANTSSEKLDNRLFQFKFVSLINVNCISTYRKEWNHSYSEDLFRKQLNYIFKNYILGIDKLAATTLKRTRKSVNMSQQ